MRSISILLTLFITALVTAGTDYCHNYTTCASCTGPFYPNPPESQNLHPKQSRQLLNPLHNHPHPHHHCFWHPTTQTCSSNHTSHPIILYPDQCPLSPTPYPPTPPTLLPNWMTLLFPNSSLSVSDLTLPGTHDSLSYDLSLIISDGCLDSHDSLSAILHDMSGGDVEVVPDGDRDFVRQQAKTQQLTIRQQLENGIRFLDLRIMMEYATEKWYSIHCLQSNHPIQYYLHQIHTWLMEHPSELLVIWLSKHGNTDAIQNDQYPHVTPQQKHSLWQTYLEIFGDMLLDTRTSSFQTTPLRDLRTKNHRVITFVSDYIELTDSSHFALDAKSIENYYQGDGLFHLETNRVAQYDYFKSIKTKKPSNNKEFTLMSMNTSGPYWQVRNAFLLRYRHPQNSVLRHQCASRFHIPGMEEWCPSTLLDIAQLTSYYNQAVLERVFRESDELAFPNALYLDALDYNGTIRTGTQCLFGLEEEEEEENRDERYESVTYAYVDTILAYNVKMACEKNGLLRGETKWCEEWRMELERRRLKYPMLLWDEWRYGRRSDWP